MASYQTKPIYVFGTFGMLAFFLSIIAGVWAFVFKFGYGTSFILTPLPDNFHCAAGNLDAVFSDGFISRNARANLSRIAGQNDLRRARKDWF